MRRGGGRVDRRGVPGAARVWERSLRRTAYFRRPGSPRRSSNGEEGTGGRRGRTRKRLISIHRNEIGGMNETLARVVEGSGMRQARPNWGGPVSPWTAISTRGRGLHGGRDGG